MSLRLRLMLLFAAIITVVASVQIGLNLWSAEQAAERFNQSLLANFQGHWEKVLKLQRGEMEVEQKSLTRDRAITKALRQEEFDAVQDSAVATFNRLSTMGAISQLDIYTKSGDLAYSSNNSSATMSGHTQEAFETQKVVSGLVTNGEGRTIQEVSFPLYYRGKLIGAARYGKDFRDAIEEFSETSHTRTVFTGIQSDTPVDPGGVYDSLEWQSSESPEPASYTVFIDDVHHIVTVLPVIDDKGKLLGHTVSALNDHETYEQEKFLKMTIFAVAVSALVLAVLILKAILGASLKPLDTAIKTLRDIESGDLETEAWKGDWKGEFAQLMSELGRMQQQLLTRTRNEQRYAEENNRTLKALDSVSNAVVVSGADNSVVYANPAAQRLFTSIESDVSCQVPGFEAKNLIGSDIDLFSILGNQSLKSDSESASQKSYEILSGNAILEMTVSSVSEQDGQRIGTVAEWRDLTLERRVVEEVKNVVADAHAGNLKQRIVLDGKDGVFLALSQSVNELITNTEAVIEDTARVLSALARGDLHESISNEYSGAYESLKNDANRTIGQLKDVVSNIQHSTGEVRQASSEIDQGNQTLGKSTVQTAERLQETSQSVEEMTSAVQQSAENSARASDLVSQANTKAQTGGQVVNQAMGAMEEINESSAKISDITSVINEIAFQTNLLALNAAVESARAGEHGKGFAVVASEVRNLASRCAVAAKEIQDLIAASIEKVENGQRLVNQTGSNLHDIVGSIEEISGLVAEISTSGKEQAVGLEQINQAITEIDNATQRNTEMVRQVSSASAEAYRQSNELSEVISFFSTNGGVNSGTQPVLPDRAA